MSRVELKELRAQRAKLEKQNHLLENKQKNLTGDIKVLEERVEIKELETSRKKLENTIFNLETQSNDLESKLQKVN